MPKNGSLSLGCTCALLSKRTLPIAVMDCRSCAFAQRNPLAQDELFYPITAPILLCCIPQTSCVMTPHKVSRRSGKPKACKVCSHNSEQVLLRCTNRPCTVPVAPLRYQSYVHRTSSRTSRIAPLHRTSRTLAPYHSYPCIDQSFFTSRTLVPHQSYHHRPSVGKGLQSMTLKMNERMSTHKKMVLCIHIYPEGSTQPSAFWERQVGHTESSFTDTGRSTPGADPAVLDWITGKEALLGERMTALEEVEHPRIVLAPALLPPNTETQPSKSSSVRESFAFRQASRGRLAL